MSAATARVAGKTIGEGHPVFVVVETGVTHGGDPATARRMVEEAAAAGADAIKCECILPDRLVAAAHRHEIEYTYTGSSGAVITRNYHELLREVSLTLDQIAEMKALADAAGLPFFGTAFDTGTVEFLVKIGACAVKISSGELFHLPLVEAAAASGLPLFLDTGLSTVADIARAVLAARAAGCRDLVVMHNPPGYPARPGDVNLRALAYLERTLGVPVGLSCHSRGTAVPLASVAAGARVVEKPVCLDNTLDADEHAFSVNLADLARFVADLREVDVAQGDPLARMRPLSASDRALRERFGQSVVSTRALPAGHVLTAADLGFARAGWGLAPDLREVLIGATLTAALPEGHVLEWHHVLRYGGRREP